MANLKFSGFTAAAAIDQTDSFLVGFDNDGGGANPTNNYWTFSEVAVGLAAVTATPYNIYVGDGTITGNRTVTMGTNTLSFSSSSAASANTVFTFNGTYTSTVGAPGTGGGGFEIAGGYGTKLKPTYLQIYSGATIQGTSSGFLTIHSTVAASAGYSIDARLGVIGLHNDNTSYAFRVQNSDLTDIFHISNDTTTTVEKNLVVKGQGYTEQHDQTGVTIDWNNSNVVYATLVSGSQTFTPTNPKSGATYILYLRQPAAGAAGTVDWNSLALWSGGTAPTLTATNGATDVITLIYNGTSTKYFGTSVLNFS